MGNYCRYCVANDTANTVGTGIASALTHWHTIIGVLQSDSDYVFILRCIITLLISASCFNHRLIVIAIRFYSDKC